MPKITNPRYREMLDQGKITLLLPEEFHEKLSKIEPKKHMEHFEQWKNFLIVLYWSGRRPVEILDLKASDVTMETDYIVIHFTTYKRGFPGVLYFSWRRIKEMKTFYNWAKNHFPDLHLFYGLRSKNKSVVKWKDQEGEPRAKEYNRTTQNLYYLINKWFGVNPYFFRHNRFSSMIKAGATPLQVKTYKGAKSISSVDVYIRISGGKELEKAARFIR